MSRNNKFLRYERGICHIDAVALVPLLRILDMPIDRFFVDASLRLKENLSATYEKYNTLFFPVVNASNNDYILYEDGG